MACYHPLKIFYTGRKTETGAKEGIVTRGNSTRISLEWASRKIKNLSWNDTMKHDENGTAYLDDYDEIPCGKCIGCKLDYSKNWAERCLLEARYHDSSKFITLTYDEDHVPKNGQLSKRDMQLFMKRLRKYTGQQLRFLICGEIGPATKRPHYHGIIFGLTLNDEYKWGNFTRSDSLERTWGKGQVIIGQVNFNTCAYVARYVVKKQKDDGSFLLMSRRPGIGFRYYMDHRGEMFADGVIYIHTDKGNQMNIPNYFKYLEKKDNRELLELISERKKPGIKAQENMKRILNGSNTLNESRAIEERKATLKQARYKRPI